MDVDAECLLSVAYRPGESAKQLLRNNCEVLLLLLHVWIIMDGWMDVTNYVMLIVMAMMISGLIAALFAPIGLN